MTPQIIKSDKYIEVIGHYDSEILCAKLTLLAELYAIEHREGYAKFQIEDKDKLELINDELEFLMKEPAVIAINGGWSGTNGTEIACYGGDEVDITSTGIEVNGVSQWTASPPSGQSFLGFSTTSGATTPDSNLEVGDSTTLSSGHTYWYSVYGTPTSSLSDLTGTKWVWNSIINWTPMQYSYSLSFTSNNMNFDTIGNFESPEDEDYLYYGFQMIYTYDFITNQWTDDVYKTIEITGGIDVTNSDFITWLEANATQIIEPTGHTITYSGDLSSYLDVKVNNISVSSGTTINNGDKVEVYLDNSYSNYELLVNDKEITDNTIRVINEDIDIEVNNAAVLTYDLTISVDGNESEVEVIINDTDTYLATPSTPFVYHIANGDNPTIQLNAISLGTDIFIDWTWYPEMFDILSGDSETDTLIINRVRSDVNITAEFLSMSM